MHSTSLIVWVVCKKSQLEFGVNIFDTFKHILLVLLLLLKVFQIILLYAWHSKCIIIIYTKPWEMLNPVFDKTKNILFMTFSLLHCILQIFVYNNKLLCTTYTCVCYIMFINN